MSRARRASRVPSWLIVVVAAVVGVTSSACSSSSPTPSTTDSQPKYGGSLTIGVRREAGELDIHKPTIGTTRQYARALYNALFAVDINGNVTGELVDTWETPDPKTYIFHLRKGVKFHDGTDFDAASVKFNFDRQLDPAEKAFYRTQLTNIATIETPDTNTVKLSLKAADATLPARLSDRAGWIISPTAIKKYGADIATHPVGTGPFQFVEWVKDDHLTLKKFADYWQTDKAGNKLPYLDEVIFRAIPDLTVLFSGVRTGEVGIIETLLPTDVAVAKADDQLSVVEGPGQIWRMGLNNTAAPFNDVHLRRAVAYGIDRDAIAEGVFRGLGTSGKYLTRPGNWAFDSSGDFYTLNADKVKAELAAAGKPQGFSFELLVNNVTSDQQVGEAVQAQLAKFGIQVKVTPLESSVAAQRRIDRKYDASTSQSPPSADPDQEVALFMETTSTTNNSGYANPEVDKLLAQARAVPDQKQRSAIYFQVQKMILADSPDVYLFNAADLKVVRKNVHGYQPAFDSFIRPANMWIA